MPPDGSDFVFYRNIFDLMIAAPGIVISGGDWNIRLNPRLDSSKNLTTTPLHRRVNALMTELGILDLWRDFYPSGRDYTFYSCPHDTYSRIDNFFVLKRDRHRVYSCDIGSINVSDHAPLSCTVLISHKVGKTLWRLNTSALNNPQFKSQMRKEIKTYLEENDNREVDSAIVWDALKSSHQGENYILLYPRKETKTIKTNKP